MHDFIYKGNELYCEGVRLRDIVRKAGSPVYIYSHKTFTDHIKKIRKAFRSIEHLICYSMKANSNLAVLKSVLGEGSGLDIVSGGELFRAKKVKCPGRKIVFAGVGKTDQEIAEAIRYGILLFNVESEPELEAIDRVARRLKKKVKVSIRVNPDVDAKTHKHITTGKAESKFGLDLAKAKSLFKQADKYTHLELCAIHVHIGSQITSAAPFVAAFRKVLAFADELKVFGITIEYLNLGGGLGVIYRDENPQTADEFAKKILPLFKGRKIKLIFEPGRFVSANGGILVTRVIYVKKTNVKQFAIVDAAMNDLIRPSFYEAYHDIRPLTKTANPKSAVYDVVGPICETGDVLATARKMPEVKTGDYLALMTSGAYGFVMSSNYNSRTRAAEVLVKGKKFWIVRRRETLDDLIRGESLPAFLK